MLSDNPMQAAPMAKAISDGLAAMPINERDEPHRQTNSRYFEPQRSTR